MRAHVTAAKTLVLFLWVILLGAGCNTESRAASKADNKAQPIEAVSIKIKTSDKKAREGGKEIHGKKTKVAKVIFVGQKDACHCTKDRIKGSWDALQGALIGTNGIEVQRIEVDVDEAMVDKLDKLGRIMVVPGIYLMDSHGKLVKFFQGQVSQDQIAKEIF